jgi:hypothetical protein
VGWTRYACLALTALHSSYCKDICSRLQVPAPFDLNCPVVAAMDCGDGVGLAVSPALEVIVTANADACTLSVFGLVPPCPLLRIVGGEGEGPLQFNQPGRMCFTVLGEDTLLVAEGTGNRIQEVLVNLDTEPSHVAFWGVGQLMEPRGVAACRALVAVSEQGAKRVSLFDAYSRHLLRRCGEPGLVPSASGSDADLLCLPRGLCFSDYGLRLVVADAGVCGLSVFDTTDGTLAYHITDDAIQGPLDVVPCLGGFLAVDCITHAVLKLSSSTDSGAQLCQLGREGDRPGEFRGPSALVLVPGVGLLVREREGARFQLFAST